MRKQDIREWSYRKLSGESVLRRNKEFFVLVDVERRIKIIIDNDYRMIWKLRRLKFDQGELGGEEVEIIKKLRLREIG